MSFRHENVKLLCFSQDLCFFNLCYFFLSLMFVIEMRIIGHTSRISHCDRINLSRAKSVVPLWLEDILREDIVFHGLNLHKKIEMR